MKYSLTSKCAVQLPQVPVAFGTASYIENEWSLRKMLQHGRKDLSSKCKYFTVRALFHYHFLPLCYQPVSFLLWRITSCIWGTFLQLSGGRFPSGRDPWCHRAAGMAAEGGFPARTTHISGLQINILCSMPNSHRPQFNLWEELKLLLPWSHLSGEEASSLKSVPVHSCLLSTSPPQHTDLAAITATTAGAGFSLSHPQHPE